MAYDPEARKQSNSALIMGLIALLVVGGAALAYFATRTPDVPETGAIITNTRKETVVVNATPAPPSTTTIIVAPTTAPVAPATPDVVVVTPPTDTRTTTTTTTRNADPAPRAPVAAPPADEPKNTVNNITINPPAPSGNSNSNAKPVKPDTARPKPEDATANAAPAAEEVEGY